MHCVSHYSKSQIFVQKFNFDKTPTFSRVFLPKKSTIFSGNQSWIFGQKMKISNSVKIYNELKIGFFFTFREFWHAMQCPLIVQHPVHKSRLSNSTPQESSAGPPAGAALADLFQTSKSWEAEKSSWLTSNFNFQFKSVSKWRNSKVSMRIEWKMSKVTKTISRLDKFPLIVTFNVIFGILLLIGKCITIMRTRNFLLPLKAENFGT